MGGCNFHPGTWRILSSALFACAVLHLATPSAFAQATDEGLDEVLYRFGAQGQAVEAIKKLGGKVQYDDRTPTKRVVAVDLSGSKVVDSDMGALCKLLKGLPKLASLDLSDTGLTEVGLNHLHGLTSLSDLNVARSKVADAGLAALRKNLRAHISLRPRDMKYFPDGAIHPGLNNYRANWYSEDLFAMREPSLWAHSRKDPKAVAFRFTYLPSFGRPLAVRVVFAGESATLYAVLLDASGYAGGKPVDRRSVKLSENQWVGLKRLVDDANFWTLPNEMWTNGIADGAGYVFEGIEGGKYHVVNANSNLTPNDRYRCYQSLCKEMIKLSDIEIKDF